MSNSTMPHFHDIHFELKATKDKTTAVSGLATDHSYVCKNGSFLIEKDGKTPVKKGKDLIPSNANEVRDAVIGNYNMDWMPRSDIVSKQYLYGAQIAGPKVTRFFDESATKIPTGRPNDNITPGMGKPLFIVPNDNHIFLFARAKDSPTNLKGGEYYMENYVPDESNTKLFQDYAKSSPIGLKGKTSKDVRLRMENQEKHKVRVVSGERTDPEGSPGFPITHAKGSPVNQRDHLQACSNCNSGYTLSKGTVSALPKKVCKRWIKVNTNKKHMLGDKNYQRVEKAKTRHGRNKPYRLLGKIRYYNGGTLTNSIDHFIPFHTNKGTTTGTYRVPETGNLFSEHPQHYTNIPYTGNTNFSNITDYADNLSKNDDNLKWINDQWEWFPLESSDHNVILVKGIDCTGNNPSSSGMGVKGYCDYPRVFPARPIDYYYKIGVHKKGNKDRWIYNSAANAFKAQNSNYDVPQVSADDIYCGYTAGNDNVADTYTHDEAQKRWRSLFYRDIHPRFPSPPGWKGIQLSAKINFGSRSTFIPGGLATNRTYYTAAKSGTDCSKSWDPSGCPKEIWNKDKYHGCVKCPPGTEVFGGGCRRCPDRHWSDPDKSGNRNCQLVSSEQTSNYSKHFGLTCGLATYEKPGNSWCASGGGKYGWRDCTAQDGDSIETGASRNKHVCIDTPSKHHGILKGDCSSYWGAANRNAWKSYTDADTDTCFKCTCPHGIPVGPKMGVGGSGCDSEGQIKCKSCNTGYYLDLSDKQCKKCKGIQVPNDQGNGCVNCPDGSIVKPDNSGCDTCPNGHFPNSAKNKCIPYQCKCSNGTGATGANCPKNGNNKCASCNAGYYLQGNQCKRCPDSTTRSGYVTSGFGTSGFVTSGYWNGQTGNQSQACHLTGVMRDWREYYQGPNGCGAAPLWPPRNARSEQKWCENDYYDKRNCNATDGDSITLTPDEKKQKNNHHVCTQTRIRTNTQRVELVPGGKHGIINGNDCSTLRVFSIYRIGTRYTQPLNEPNKTCFKCKCEHNGKVVGVPAGPKIGAGSSGCDHEGQNKCKSCKKGYYLQGNQCLPCPINTYQDRMNNTSNVGSCKPCNSGAPNSPAGSTSRNDCKPNQCTCSNGTKATGTDCTSNGGNICASCDYNHYLDPNDKQCKVCTPAGGKPTVQYSSKANTAGSDSCKKVTNDWVTNFQANCPTALGWCSGGTASGYKMRNCKAKDGNSIELTSISKGSSNQYHVCVGSQTHHGIRNSDCSTIWSRYILGAKDAWVRYTNTTRETCFKCKCEHNGTVVGVPVGPKIGLPMGAARDAGCDREGQNKCKSCNTGYYLDSNDKQCKINNCTCSNGTPATGKNCPKNGSNKCASCNAGYYLDSSDNKCKINRCTCKERDSSGNLTRKIVGNGETGANCPSNGSNKCKSCDYNHYLDPSDKQCKVCTPLANGTPRVQYSSNKNTAGSDSCKKVTNDWVTNFQANCPTALGWCSGGTASGYKMRNCNANDGNSIELTSISKGSSNQHHVCLDPRHHSIRNSNSNCTYERPWKLKTDTSLQNKTCYKCKCEHNGTVVGVPVGPKINPSIGSSGCDHEGQNKCKSCNAGYRLVDKLGPNDDSKITRTDNDCKNSTNGCKCAPNVCSCSHGSGATGGNCPSHGTIKCVNCNAGYYLDSSDNQCKKCTGNKVPNTARTACETCPSGQVPNATQTACETCSAGKVPNATQTACKTCPTGKVPNATRTLCETCPSGQVPNATQTACEICSTGKVPNATQTACKTCPTGESPNSDQTKCIPNTCTCQKRDSSGKLTGQIVGYKATGAACDSSSNKCTSCYHDYYLDSSDNQCKLCNGGKVRYWSNQNKCQTPPSSTNPNLKTLYTYILNTSSASGAQGDDLTRATKEVRNWCLDPTYSYKVRKCELTDGSNLDVTNPSQGSVVSTSKKQYHVCLRKNNSTNFNQSSVRKTRASSGAPVFTLGTGNNIVVTSQNKFTDTTNTCFQCKCEHNGTVVGVPVGPKIGVGAPGCDHEGQNKCKSCNRGYYLQGNQCIRCPINTYQGQDGFTGRSCTQCGPGKSSLAGSTSINACIQNVCTCSNGTDATGVNCTSQGGNLCQNPCNGGYVLNASNVCVEKGCTNTDNAPANGSKGDCPSTLSSGAKCKPLCNTNYQGDQSIIPRKCLKGKLTQNTICSRTSCSITSPPANGAMGNCQSKLNSGDSCTPKCNKGYRLGSNNTCIGIAGGGTLSSTAKCISNKCVCLNGNPTNHQTNPKCLKNGETQCISCKAGYRLVDRDGGNDNSKQSRSVEYCKTNKCKCVPNICTCNNGTAATQTTNPYKCLTNKKEHCNSCNPGWKLDTSNNKCVKTPDCIGGNSANPQPSDNYCESCFYNHYFKNNSCLQCKKNTKGQPTVQYTSNANTAGSDSCSKVTNDWVTNFQTNCPTALGWCIAGTASGYKTRNCNAKDGNLINLTSITKTPGKSDQHHVCLSSTHHGIRNSDCTSYWSSITNAKKTLSTVGDDTCFKCKCQNGTPVGPKIGVGSNGCGKEDDNHCKKCDPGYHLVDITEQKDDRQKTKRDEKYCETNKCKCVKNVCSCSGGTPSDDGTCLKHKGEHCKQCNPNRVLDLKSSTSGPICREWGGSCLHGNLIDKDNRRMNNHCGSCDSGYTINNQTTPPICRAWLGNCKDGKTVDIKNRTGPQECGSCNPGYHLVNKKCVKCIDGTYTLNTLNKPTEYCRIPDIGEKILTPTSTTAQTCSCPNGTLNSLTNCSTDLHTKKYGEALNITKGKKEIQITQPNNIVKVKGLTNPLSPEESKNIIRILSDRHKQNNIQRVSCSVCKKGYYLNKNNECISITCQCPSGCVKITEEKDKTNKDSCKSNSKNLFWDKLSGKCYECIKSIEATKMTGPGVAVKCSQNKEESCVICTKPGTWLNGGKCVPWSKCKPGQIQIKEGTNRSDRVCGTSGPCPKDQWESKPPTATSLRYCKSVGVCRNGSLISPAKQKQTHHCQSCKPGFRLCENRTECEKSSNKPSLISDPDEKRRWLPYRDCVMNVCKCSNGTSVTGVQNSPNSSPFCTINNQEMCEKCNPGFYLVKGKDSSGNKLQKCVPWTQCLKSEWIQQSGSPTQNRICKPCPKETLNKNYSKNSNLIGKITDCKCHSGYEIPIKDEKGNITDLKCECLNGTLQEIKTGEKDCVCNSGYYGGGKKNKKIKGMGDYKPYNDCILTKKCKCSNGIGATNIPCSLRSIKSISDKRVTNTSDRGACPFVNSRGNVWKPSMGPLSSPINTGFKQSNKTCPQNDEELCESCFDGYELNKKSFKLKGKIIKANTTCVPVKAPSVVSNQVQPRPRPKQTGSIRVPQKKVNTMQINNATLQKYQQMIKFNQR